MRRISNPRSWLGFAFAVTVLAMPVVRAHRASDSYLTLQVHGSMISGQWDVALHDLNQVTPLDINDDGNIERSEVLSRKQEIAAYATSRLHLKAAGTASPIEIRDLLVEEFSDGIYAVLRFDFPAPRTPRTVEVTYQAFFDVDVRHRGLMRLEYEGASQAAVFSPDKPVQRFELAGGSAWREFLDFAREGVWHIWIGFDHILFLLALLLPSVLIRKATGWVVVEGFRPAFIKVLKIVTAFTVAHSVTLSLATLQIVQLPSRWVESTIAASVILAALHNLRPIFPERGWVVAFAFGLIHGFGFANVLADLGLSKGSLALALVGFNLGVEAGQLAIVTAFLPIAFSLRGSWLYQRVTFQGGSALIVLLAATWMVERIWEFKLLPF